LSPGGHRGGVPGRARLEPRRNPAPARQERAARGGESLIAGKCGQGYAASKISTRGLERGRAGRWFGAFVSSRMRVSPGAEPVGDVVGQRAEHAERTPAPQNAQQQQGVRALDQSLIDKVGHDSLKPVAGTQASGCMNWAWAEAPCFRPVIYRERRNFNVSSRRRVAT